MPTYSSDITLMYTGLGFFALAVYYYLFIMKIEDKNCDIGYVYKDGKCILIPVPSAPAPVFSAPSAPAPAHVAPGAIDVNNSLITNPYKEEGDLFGAGFQQIEEIEIAKGMNDVNTVCYPKCLNNTNCAGFGYSIADRYDGRTNGNCWFMKAPIQHTRLDIKTPGVGGVWIKKY